MMFERNKNLSEFSNYKIGGMADYFFAAQTLDELRAALIEWGDKGKLFILGGATNLLINDDGFRGLVLKPNITHIIMEGDVVRVGAGALVKDVLSMAAVHGLSGLEWAGGLPGTIGGAVRGNAGAFGGETKDRVVEVQSLTVESKNPQMIIRKKVECRFGYRNSVFKENDGKEIVVEALFELTKGDVEAIKKATEEKINYRTTCHPIELPNIGSIFKNVDVGDVPDSVKKQFEKVIKHDPFPVIPTACLLAEAGLKGVTHGGAMISPKHPNFIVNVNHAKAADVKALIALVKKTIYEKFGVILEEEVIYVE